MRDLGVFRSKGAISSTVERGYLLMNELKIHRYIMPGIESNMYLMIADESALIIDPNVNSDALALMVQRQIRKVLVLLSHEHYDHISGINWLRENLPDCALEVVATEAAAEALQDPSQNLAKFWEVLLMGKPPEKIQAGMSVADVNYSCYADQTFSEELQLSWEGHDIRMQSAPGHSKGGALIFLDGNILFSGDNLVNGAGVICRLPGGNWKSYCEKARPVIDKLPDDICIMPGHGDSAKLFEVRKYLDKFGSVL